jgi:hypothetical protein
VIRARSARGPRAGPRGPLGGALGAAAAAGFAVLTACAGGLGRAEAAFAEGRYPDAQRDLAALETESRGWNDGRRAEYALYRGLTDSALGDRERARLWLREARAIEEAHPGSLSREDRQRLGAGIEGAADRPGGL